MFVSCFSAYLEVYTLLYDHAHVPVCIHVSVYLDIFVGYMHTFILSYVLSAYICTNVGPSFS